MKLLVGAYFAHIGRKVRIAGFTPLKRLKMGEIFALPAEPTENKILVMRKLGGEMKQPFVENKWRIYGSSQV